MQELWQLGLSSWKNMCYNSNDRVFSDAGASAYEGTGAGIH